METSMNKPTPHQPLPVLGSARTSEVALNLSAEDTAATRAEGVPAPVAKSSYRLSANGEKIVRAPHASRYSHF
jgi:hypothetical protein